MSTKIRHGKHKTNAYGGLNAIYPEMEKSGLLALINRELGPRVKQSKYSYSHVFASHILNNFAGSQRLEHSNRYKRELDNIKNVIIPSPDTTGRVIKSLAVESSTTKANGYYELHEFNSNTPINNILQKLAIKLNLIDPNGNNTLDYDNTIIQAKKFDATNSYKKIDGSAIVGYQPAVASVNGVPVFLEGRLGHTSAKTNIGKTTADCVELLKTNGIAITRFRGDSASFTNEVINYMLDQEIEYFIRYMNRIEVKLKLRWEVPDEEWTPYEYGGLDCHVTSIFVEVTSGNHKGTLQRVVAKRIKFDNGTTHFSCIITNNRTMSDAEVISFYNNRGAEEKRFAELKNEFNLSKLPFSFLSENTVYMGLSLISYQFYKYILKKIGRINSKFFKNIWLREFRKEFICYTVLISSKGNFEFFNVNEETLSMFRTFFEEF